MRPRRFLPSIRHLLAFDAVVRNRSVTAAAKELDLTQSTVSRLVLALEEQLGKELFTRQNKRLVPNAAALTYQIDVARALDLIQKASTSVVTNPEGGTISLAVLPTFATRWLAPRLGDFLKQHPGVSVNLSTRIQRFEFSGEVFDAAIYFGEPSWAGVNHLKLIDERVTACASPEFVATHDLTNPEGLADFPMLYLESRLNAWTDWFEAQSVETQSGRGMMMDQFSMMIQAAISGIGVALLPDYLAQIEIAEGRLVPVLKQAVRVRGSYWLVWPDEKTELRPLSAFRSWLTEQTASEPRK